MIIFLLITQIGIKPDNLTFRQVNSSIVPSYLYSSFAEEPVNANKSWMITEPLGWFLGGLVGGVILECMGILIYPPTDETLAGWLFSGASIGLGSGYLIGSGLGIWITGKRIEKENGKWYWPVIGSVLGSAIGALGGYAIDRHELTAIPLALVGSLAGGLILYRKSLR